MNILITGGCGFVGSNTAISLKTEGHQITCLDNLLRRGSELILSRVLEHGCEFIHGDIRNYEDLNKLDQNYDIMIECSAEPSVLAGINGRDAYPLININLNGAINCFEYCRRTQTGIIFLSTSRIYPYDIISSFNYIEEETRFILNENEFNYSEEGIGVDFQLNGLRSLYGATKLAAEFILKEYSNNYNIPSIINRFGVIAGPWQLGKVDQGVFTFWMANHFFKKPLNYIGYGGKGKQVRDVIHINDAIDLLKIQIKALDRYKGEIFNVGGGSFSSLSLLETTKICEELTGNKLNINSIIDNRPADLIWFKMNNSKTEAEFSWKPQRSAIKILEDIFLWMKSNESLANEIFNK
ncbi:MAG: NAD-dependent epimerase/dehydratase family protein [Lentimicrobium sp.]